MSLNNFNQHVPMYRQASKNLSDFNRYSNFLSGMGEKTKLYSNLQTAQGIINVLIEDRDIIPGDINHQIIVKCLDNMTSIYSKPNLSTKDIEQFYITYEGIEDIHKKVRSDPND